MKKVFFAFILYTVLYVCDSPSTWGRASFKKQNPSVLGIFAGSTPCDNMIRPLHSIPQQADCAFVEWTLVLYQDPVTLKPASYKLTAVNRFITKETNMYSQPGTRSERQGKWTMARGVKMNADAIVYRLEPDTPELATDFFKLSDSLLHLLDKDGNLMIGNAGWSYTLSLVAN